MILLRFGDWISHDATNVRIDLNDFGCDVKIRFPIGSDFPIICEVKELNVRAAMKRLVWGDFFIFATRSNLINIENGTSEMEVSFRNFGKWECEFK